MPKSVPFTKKQIEKLAERYPTPFYIYDESGIRESVRKLTKAFSWNTGFTEYFAVKATPNPAILKILKEEGCGMDCSSLAELILSEKIRSTGSEIMFTSNNTPVEDFIKAAELKAIINLDDIGHIEFLEKVTGLPELLSFRYNPGGSRSGNAIIGKPEEAKFGLTKEQLFEAYRIAKSKGVKRFGLHTMIISNELSPDYFLSTAQMIFEIVTELKSKEGISVEFVNLGGGIGIPYKPEDKEIDIETLGEDIKDLYEKFEFKDIKLFMECGRYITGSHGYLVTKVRHLKHTYKNYAGMDASMSDLMRPAMYGAYHHISILGKESMPATKTYDITGSLCENNDKFAIDRMLPELQEDDILVIHDTGAHGHSMGFTYNGKLRHAEFLMQGTEFKMIRRAENIQDHFATLDV